MIVYKNTFLIFSLPMLICGSLSICDELEGKVDHPEPIVSIFKDQKITGLVFLTLTTEELEFLVPILEERKVIINLINFLKVNKETATKVNYSYTDYLVYTCYI